MLSVNMIYISFNLPLREEDIPKWRGAFIEMDKRKQSLFHNHHGEKGYYYRYPLIQYGTNEGDACITAIGEGFQALRESLSARDWILRWKNRPFKLEVKSINIDEYQAKVYQEPSFVYNLQSYLPFNDTNFKDWQESPNLIARIELLNRLVTSHLLVFAKGINWNVSERIITDITLINGSYQFKLHDIGRPAFDLQFKTNMCLPEGIGLGKGVSHGCGRIHSSV